LVLPMRPVLLACLAVVALVLGACGIDTSSPPPTASPSASVTTPPAAPRSAAPGQTTQPPPVARYAKLRVFVASENTEQVWVLEGAPGAPFAVVGKIPVGKLPHQMAVSPDGKWVAVNNRLSASTSIIDPLTMKEVIRLKVGNSPHGDHLLAGFPDALRRA